MTTPRPVEIDDLQFEVGVRTAGLHALLDARGDIAAQLAAFRKARRELNRLIRRVERAEMERAQ